MRPRSITFIIPAHNEEALIGACLNSVVREVRRTNCDAEIIVVDNASNDRTGEIARGFPEVTVIEEPRKGLSFARQAGFEVSKNELLAYIDADSRMPEGWINTVLIEFSQHKDVVALSGPQLFYDLPLAQAWLSRFLLVYIPACTNFVVYRLLRRGSMLHGGNCVMRRAAFEKIDGFDTSIDFYGDDTDLGKRMSKVGRVKWTPHLRMEASGRRIEHEGIAATVARYSLNYLSIIFGGRPLTTHHVDIRIDTRSS